MKMTKTIPLAASVLLSSLNPQLSTVFAQGSLTPPDAPAPTMKSLSEIEPRIAITNSGLATITRPGSYYLTTNVTVSAGHGINIQTDNVTLDLNGFTVASTAPSAAAGGSGILIGDEGNPQQRRNITIQNGFIRGGVTNNAGVFDGPGFQNGIYYATISPQNVRIANVSIEGVYGQGILLGQNATIVESCAIRTAGLNGISAASVSHSTAHDCGIGGIGAKAADHCQGSTVSGIGVSATTAHNCHGTSTSGTGLSATTANNCIGVSTSGIGLQATTANNCHGTSSSANGLVANVAIGCYGTSGTTIGLRAFIANSCNGSGFPGTHATNKYNMP
jgi:hypothetical protein